MPVAARWTEPALRREPLRAYAREAEVRTLALLDESLGSGGPAPNEVVQRRLLDAAPRDIEELKRHLEPRAEESARTAAEALRERGEREAKLLSETLERQRGRVMEEIERHRREFQQIAMDFGSDEGGRQQLEANMRHWERRLAQFDADLERRAGAYSALLRRPADASGAGGACVSVAGVELTTSQMQACT